MSDILIVEDETVLARSIVSFLERRGFAASFATDAASARVQFERDEPRLVVLDYKLDRDDGLELLTWMSEKNPSAHIVMMTGHGDIDVAVRAMKAGARDFLVKPTPLASIASLAAELMLSDLHGGNERTGVDRIIGRSSVANALRTAIKKLAKPATPRPGVLIMGAQGTGKTVAGIALHEMCAPDQPISIVDCRTSSTSFLVDAFEKAGRGTLLLRHVSELAPDAQAAVLDLVNRAAEAPALVATSQNHLTPGSGFLPDLLYRIQVGWIEMMPLNQRASDVLPLAEHFARCAAREHGQRRPRLTAGARAKLLEHDWPGNVAELKNCMERAVLLQNANMIDANNIQLISNRTEGEIPTLQELELGAINKALSKTDGNVSKAAVILGVSRDTLRYRMEKLSLSRR